MKKLFYILLVLPLLFLSCDKCKKVDCGCLATADNGFAFLPETNPQKSDFSSGEYNTIILRKYTKGMGQLLLTDTFTLDGSRSRITGDPKTTYFRYNRSWDGWPFDAIYIHRESPRHNGEGYADFDYIIQVGEVKQFRITDISIEGHHENVDCCNCYKNHVKVLNLNNSPLNFSGNQSSNAVIMLEK